MGCYASLFLPKDDKTIEIQFYGGDFVDLHIGDTVPFRKLGPGQAYFNDAVYEGYSGDGTWAVVIKDGKVVDAIPKPAEPADCTDAYEHSLNFLHDVRVKYSLPSENDPCPREWWSDEEWAIHEENERLARERAEEKQKLRLKDYCVRLGKCESDLTAEELAAFFIGNYTREKMSEDGFFRKILPPVTL